jgi:hypothetical protein
MAENPADYFMGLMQGGTVDEGEGTDLDLPALWRTQQAALLASISTSSTSTPLLSMDLRGVAQSVPEAYKAWVLFRRWLLQAVRSAVPDVSASPGMPEQDIDALRRTIGPTELGLKLGCAPADRLYPAKVARQALTWGVLSSDGNGRQRTVSSFSGACS